MPSATATAARGSARERLLAAADELFYEEGIHTVGIDRVIERAGVAKATLYSAFGSKDELIRAYLQGRLAARQERIRTAITPLDDPRDQILEVFRSLGRYAAATDYRGCAFANAGAEAPHGSAIEQECDASRAWTRSLFRDLAVAAAAHDPDLLADQLTQLYDGAMMSARMDRSTRATDVAITTAGLLVDAAVR
jgi:AcrR family transcriptional regulator